MNPTAVKCIAITGATATGKSELGIDLAPRFGGEIVSMDSRQVYRGMDIGTGKVTPEQQRLVPHHLLDILDPDQPNSAGGHAKLARESIREIERRGNTPFLVGGTGLYFDALFHPLIEVSIPARRKESIRSNLDSCSTPQLYKKLGEADPARAAELAPNDRARISRALEVFLSTGKPQSEYFFEQGNRTSDYEYLKIVLTLPRKILREKIDRRTRNMFAAGWVDEVRSLLDAGYRPGAAGMNSLGYAEIAGAILAGKNPRSVVDKVVTLTRQYAKRQETFFRKDPDAVWCDASASDYPASAGALVEAFLRPE